jgi:DNA-binding NarL/FixJ family response regulator
VTSVVAIFSRRNTLLFPTPSQRVGQMNKIRILLADDHPHFPELVESLLGATFEVVGIVGDGRTLVDAGLNLKPDVILTDISMPVVNGIEAVEQLRKAGCVSKIIFLTVHSDPDFVRACLAAGALGYILKTRVSLDLLAAIREALAGHLFVSRFDAEQN